LRRRLHQPEDLLGQLAILEPELEDPRAEQTGRSLVEHIVEAMKVPMLLWTIASS
jgi:hypothetical protein